MHIRCPSSALQARPIGARQVRSGPLTSVNGGRSHSRRYEETTDNRDRPRVADRVEAQTYRVDVAFEVAPARPRSARGARPAVAAGAQTLLVTSTAAKRVAPTRTWLFPAVGPPRGAGAT